MLFMCFEDIVVQYDILVAFVVAFALKIGLILFQGLRAEDLKRPAQKVGKKLISTK